MSSIHYKFKTTLDYKSISFDGVALSLSDLKKAIFQQRRMKMGEIDLEVTNAQTKEVYKNNDDMIPKNSSVIVARVPIPVSNKNSNSLLWEAFKQKRAREEKEKEKAAQEQASQAGDLTNAKSSEIDRIKAMMSQSTRDFNPANYKNKVPLGPPPPEYRCNKCGKGGHYIYSCTEKNENSIMEPKFKRSTGIPNSFLTITNDPTAPGALLTFSGKFAVPKIDANAYAIGKKERPPFLPGQNNEQVEEVKPEIPQVLQCSLCKGILRDAVLIPCCGNSFCDECIRNKLLETEDHECPSCQEQDVSPDKLVANKLTRTAVTNFLNDKSYSGVVNRSVDRLLDERRSASPGNSPSSISQTSYLSPSSETAHPTSTASQQPPATANSKTGQKANLPTYLAWRKHNQQMAASQQAKQQSQQQAVQTITSTGGQQIRTHTQSVAGRATSQSQPHHTQPIASRTPTQPQSQPIAGRTPPSQSQPVPVARTHQPQAQSITSMRTNPHSQPGAANPQAIRQSQYQAASQPMGRTHPQSNNLTTVLQSMNSPSLSQQSERSNTPEDRAPTPVKDEQLHPPGVDEPMVNAISVLGQPNKAAQPVHALSGAQSVRPPYVPSNPISSLPAYPPPGSDGLPPNMLAPPPAGYPGAPLPVPVAPYVAPPFAGGPPPPFPPFVPAPTEIPMSKEEFYRRQRRLKEAVKEKKPCDVMDHFATSFMERKRPKSRSRTRSRSKSPRSRSRTPRRGRSMTPKRSRTPRRSRSRSRSFTPIRKRSRSRTPYRSRTRSRTPPVRRFRTRSRSRSRSRYRTRSRSRYRSRSRSYMRSPRSPSRGRYRSYSRSPVRYRRYSRSRSRTPPPRRFSPRRSRSPRPRSRSLSRSPGRYPDSRRWSPRPLGRGSPDRFSPPPRYPPSYNLGPPPPNNRYYRFDGPPPPFFGNVPPRFGIGPPPPHPPILPVGPPPLGYNMYPRPPPPLMGSQSRSPKRMGRSSPPPRDRYAHDRPYDRKEYSKDKISDRSRNVDDRYQEKGRYPKDTAIKDREKDRDVYSRKNEGEKDRDMYSRKNEGEKDRDGYSRRGEGERSREKDMQSLPSDPSKTRSSKDKKEEKANGRKEKREESREKEKVEGKVKKKKESKKKDKSEKRKREKSKEKKKVEKDMESEKEDQNEGSGKPVESYSKNSNASLIFLTGGGDVANDKIEAVNNEDESVDKKEDQSGETEKTISSHLKKPKKLKKRSKSSTVADETSDSATEPKSKSHRGKKLGDNLVEYNESSGDHSGKPMTKKKAKVAKLKPELKSEDPVDEKPITASGSEEDKNMINRAPPSPHDDVPSSPLNTTDGVHEDEPSPPGVSDKTDLLDKPQLMLDLPELSKWERDDIDEESDHEAPTKAEIKKSLPRSVIEKAEKALTQKPLKITSSITSPVRSQSKKRRVYLDEEEDTEKKKEILEENRRVHSKHKSMQITISSKDKQRQEERERREDKRSSRPRKDETERKSVFSRMKMDDNDVRCKERRDTETRSSQGDNNTSKIRDLREKLPVRTDRRDDRFEKYKQEDSKERMSRKLSDSSHRDSERERTPKGTAESRSDKQSESEKLRNRKNSGSGEKNEGKTRPAIDRKESLLDESLFEPDYNEEESQSEMSSAEDPPAMDGRSRSVSSNESSSSPTKDKKRKRSDTSDEEKSPKKSKHKKHKHKHKTGKHKHKKKKSKKREQE